MRKKSENCNVQRLCDLSGEKNTSLRLKKLLKGNMEAY